MHARPVWLNVCLCVYVYINIFFNMQIFYIKATNQQQVLETRELLSSSWICHWISGRVESWPENWHQGYLSTASSVVREAESVRMIHYKLINWQAVLKVVFSMLEPYYGSPVPDFWNCRAIASCPEYFMSGLL